jgi:hypothetical protein
MESWRKYTRSKALKKLTAKRRNHFTKNVPKFFKNEFFSNKKSGKFYGILKLIKFT